MQDWELIDSELVYDGFRKIEKRKYRLPSGAEEEFDIILASPSVCALVITTDKEVVLAKQFRPGPGKILLELPGGGIDDNENPIDAAAREVFEETGYQGDVVYVGSAYKNAYSTYEVKSFLITNARKVTEPKNDATEQTEPVLLTMEKFKEHLATGQLTDITTAYLALQHLGL